MLKYKTLFVSLFLIIATIHLTGCYSQSTWIYEDEIDGFQLSFPGGWSKTENYPDTEERLIEEGLRKIYFGKGDTKFGTQESIIILIHDDTYQTPPIQTYLDYLTEEVKIDGIDTEKIIKVQKETNEIIGISFYFKKEERYFSILLNSQPNKWEELSDMFISGFRFNK